MIWCFGIFRYAVVTGANKGIGFETVRQLATAGVTVILTARDEKRGIDAVKSLLHGSGLSNIVFHQLDVQDPKSIDSLVKFIQSKFGKLDILVRIIAMFLWQFNISIKQIYDSKFLHMFFKTDGFM